MKKKALSLLLCLCAVLSLLPASALAASLVNLVNITVEAPKVGAVPDDKATVPSNMSTEVLSTTWVGTLSGSSFAQGETYTARFQIGIKAGVSRTFAGINSINATVNGQKAKVTKGNDTEITVEYTWKEVGGPAPTTPEGELKARLAALAGAFPATNGTTEDDVITYLKEKLPAGAEVWRAGGTFTSKIKKATATKAGWFSMGVGVTLNGVTVEPYQFHADIPALNESPDATNLAADKAAMQAALKSFSCTADTTGDDILAVMNAAATHGTKAGWADNYYRKAPTATGQGEIKGDVVLTLGTQSDVIRSVLKILPIAGDATDALLDADRNEISHALNAMTEALTNATTKEDFVKAATDVAKNGSSVVCDDFQRTAATFEADGKIVANFTVSLNDKTRPLRITGEIPMLVRDLPDDKISVTREEWDVLRLTNIERFKAGALPYTMPGVLQDATDVRAEELKTEYSHTRPNGKGPFSAIDSAFSKGRTTGENIAAGYGTPASTVTGWMNSEGHRHNILDWNYTYLGVGCTVPDSNYWVQMFASGGTAHSVVSSTGSFRFANEEELQKAYLICTSSDGTVSYMPLDLGYLTKNGNQYTLKMDSPEEIVFTVGEGGAGETAPGFTDVKATAYYADAVTWAVGKKITAGTSATTFTPDRTCTRSEILTFLWRAVGSPAATISNPFTDVKSTDFYYGAALWAAEKGMVTGSTFGANTPCTRSATVTYLWQNAGSPGATVSTSFTDVPANAAYAQAVAWAVERGVTSGTGATTFSPDSTCDRGQIVTFLYRALK